MTLSWQYVWTLVDLGYIELWEGNMAQAKAIFGQSIQQFQKADRFAGVIYAIEGLAGLHVRQELFERATRLLAWADAMREKIGDRRPPIEQASVDRDLAVIRSKLNRDDYAKVSAEGSTMTIEQAIAVALED
jgi:hypothetical protein